MKLNLLFAAGAFAIVSLMMPLKAHAIGEWICDGYDDKSDKDRCFDMIQGSSDCTMAYIYAIKDCDKGARSAHKKNDEMARDIYYNKSKGQYKVNQAAGNMTALLSNAAPLYREAGESCKALLPKCAASCSDGPLAECNYLVNKRVQEIFAIADTHDGQNLKEAKKTYNLSSSDVATAQIVAPENIGASNPTGFEKNGCKSGAFCAEYWGMKTASVVGGASKSDFEP